MTVEEQILSNKILLVDCEDASELSKNDKEAFTLLRKNGLGASDSSVFLGVNKWRDVQSLIEEKCTPGVTAEDIAIGEKENVRKGADLEELILKKFRDWSGFETAKPKAQYRLAANPYLTINFDGVTLLGGVLIPVEAKFVSAFANKYWNKALAIDHPIQGTRKMCGGSNLQAHILEASEQYGIPEYYFTQVQQQLMGLDAEFGYLAALFDKGWELKVFKIYNDAYVQSQIRLVGGDVWGAVQRNKGSH